MQQTHLHLPRLTRAKRFSFAIGLCALALALTHCSSDEANSGGNDVEQPQSSEASTSVNFVLTSAENHLDVIPNDAMGVILINAKSLNDKCQWQTLQHHDAWDVFAEQMGEFQFPDNGNDWYAEQGMNVDGPTALWVTMKEEEVMFGCSFGIENAKQFGEYMIESTGDLGFSIRIQEDGDFRFIEPFIESEFCMIWNDEKAVLAGVENRYRMGSPRDKALEWLSLDEDDQLLSERDFQSLLNEDRDVSFWMNGGSVVQLMEPQNDIPDVLMDVFGEAVIGNLVSTLNFDEGSMTFEGWRTGNIDPSMGMFDQQFNKTLLSYVSADVPVVMSMAMNIDALEGMAEASMSSREWQELQLPLQMFGIDAFSDVLGGSAILALHGMELQETDDYGYYYGPQLQPVVSMLVEIESKNLLDQVSLMLDMQGLIVDEGDFYSMENPDGSDVYIDWDSSALLVTTDRETARNFERGGFGRQSLGGDSQVSADIAGSIVYAQIDWEGLLRESEMRCTRGNAFVRDGYRFFRQTECVRCLGQNHDHGFWRPGNSEIEHGGYSDEQSGIFVGDHAGST